MPRSIGGGVGLKSPSLFSLDRRRHSVSSAESFIFSQLDDDAGEAVRHSICYEKLPHQFFFKLSILKLDGSCFDVQIGRTATVAELKEAVENLFRFHPKENQSNISWSHVWGHFCLCFEGQKLLNDKDYIQSFRIKDGDQLYFIRHLSININLTNKRSKTQTAACRKRYMSLLESQVHEMNEENGQNDINSGALEVMHSKNYHCEGRDEPVLGQQEFRFSHFLKGWFSFSKLLFVGKPRSQCKVLPSRLSGKFVKLGTKFTLTRL